jgi:lysophospholipase L1-like esterase
MMNFPALKGFSIPEGKVIKIAVDGKTLWQAKNDVAKYRYVSFGDSIAVGHRINDAWETDYGWDAQYGEDGRKETVLVPNCYTDLIRRYLNDVCGDDGVEVTSFARSGDKVKDLMLKLTHSTVKGALEEADYVTVCIGANDVLHYALVGLSEYLDTGDLSTIDAQVAASLAVLQNDSASTSYWSLFNKLYEINPNAKYVFTTVYNPYKYLWIDGSKNGFFKPMIDTIPQITVYGLEIDELIKESLLNTEVIKTYVNRINAMCDKGEEYVTQLNTILRNKITAFQASHPNFLLADTKALFDSVPDRVGAGEVHYNDLVNVEYTRGFNTADIRWYPLWIDEYGDDYARYWTDLATKYVSWEKGFDIMGFARDLAPQIIEKIIEPNVDPHPEEDGHYVLYRSFADTLGWESLNSISFNANGGAGSMSQQRVLDASVVNGVSKKIYSHVKANEFSPIAHYHFSAWKSNDGSRYSDKQAIYVPSSISLTAQWEINKRTLTVVQGADSVALARLFSRDYSNRRLYIGDFENQRYLNSDKKAWDLPLKNTDTFEVAYGQPIKMVVTGNVERIFPIGDAPKPNCSISQYNGTDYVEKVVNKVAEANFFMPDRDITIEYHFNYAANIQYSHSYWLGYIGDKDLAVTYSGSTN